MTKTEVMGKTISSMELTINLLTQKLRGQQSVIDQQAALLDTYREEIYTEQVDADYAWLEELSGYITDLKELTERTPDIPGYIMDRLEQVASSLNKKLSGYEQNTMKKGHSTNWGGIQ